MTTTIVRLLVAAWILFTLARAARAAWAQRQLVTTIWRRIRLRHVAGAFGMLALVGAVAIGLLTLLPWTSYGFGSLIGFTGNAVFVPLEEAAARAPAASVGGPDWALITLTSVFLGGLLVLLPWLAFVEEEVFRAGLEDASLPKQLLSALIFGLAHLVMLVPLAATLAVGLAGYLYGRAYRAGYANADGGALPEPVRHAFRPTRRSRAAVRRHHARRATAGQVDAAGLLLLDHEPEHRQAAGVLASTVWHTTFNSMVVVLVWISVVVEAWS